MTRPFKQTLAVGTILCLTLAPQVLWAHGAGESKSDSKHAGAKSPENLLKGVVHFGDNDVRFRTAEGLAVFVDPMAGPTDPLAASKGMVKPDLILITHPHGDHFNAEVIREYIGVNPGVVLAGPEEVCRAANETGIDRMKTVAPGNEYAMAGAHFMAVPAYLTESRSHPKESGWVGYVLKLNGATYYVTGDTGPLPEMAELEADVIFPLLYGCGGNVEQAVKMAELSKVSLVVPVHHGGRVEVINKFIGQLPKGTEGLYFAKGNATAVE